MFSHAREAEFAIMSLCTHLFLVTRAAWERFEFLIKRVGDLRSFPSRVFNYALLTLYSVGLDHVSGHTRPSPCLTRTHNNLNNNNFACGGEGWGRGYVDSTKAVSKAV